MPAYVATQLWRDSLRFAIRFSRQWLAEPKLIERRLVVGNGLSSNFSDSFLEEFQACNDLFEHPPIPMGKQYIWQPISVAA